MNFIDKSYTITKNQYNYLLPVFGVDGSNKLLSKNDKFYFIGTKYEYKELLNRCIYLYD